MKTQKPGSVMLLVIASMLLIAGCQSNQPTLNSGHQYFAKKQYAEAFHALMPAAAAGHADAQYAVGYMYYYGYGIGRDPELAEYWLRSAAKQNQTKAIDALSLIDRAKYYSTK
jgi:TPR repeat protein